ncbi:LysR family transcriptional regulator [Rhizobium sp. FKY42]|uniref:LysR family transcriptional regulator n=1 Tax=Rhizobium sp. FKY42 TaxID=2562310 RepID=UPI0014853F9A|nr:LysR family transcriptional regulator [Rhizobium sp. FKY42]
MRFERLDLNLLVAFDAIVTEGSVTSAAEKLHLSQSAMSSALGRLRDFFGDELFVRVGRDQRATPLAEALAGPVREVLRDVQSNIIRRQPFDPKTSTLQFSLAVSDFMTQVVVSDLARHLCEVAPLTRLNLTPLRGEAVRRRFVAGEIDFLLCPQSVMVPELPYERLFSEGFKVVGCAQHWQDTSVLTRKQFEEAGHVAVRLGEQQTPGIDELICLNAGIDRRIQVIVGAFDHVAAFVAGTHRLAMLQSGMAERVASQWDLKIFNTPFDSQSFTEVLQWQPVNANSSAHVWFRDVAIRRIREQFARSEPEGSSIL